MNDNSAKKKDHRSTRWRSRVGGRVAAAGLSLALLGGGAAIASQPVHAGTKSTITTTKATTSDPTVSFAGWGG